MAGEAFDGGMNLKRDWFLLGLLAAIGLAWLFPEPGAQGGWLYPQWTTKGGIALIFFLHGMGLPLTALRQGAARWKLHAVVQAAVFLLFPLIGLLLLWLTRGWLAEDLRVGLFYLCALPSTVSSSVAMTAVAGGNVSASIFNATLSSMLGIVLTPLWLKIVAGEAGASFDIGPVIIDLLLWLVLPLVVGQLSRRWTAQWAKRNKPLVSTVDRLTILMLVYTSFCDSVQFGVWTQYGTEAVVVSLVASVLLFVIVYRLVRLVCRWLDFPREDRITALFCGSKKSLATGVPMVQLMFGTGPSLGLILLPIMVYHTYQLVICGMLANRWQQQTLDAAVGESV